MSERMREDVILICPTCGGSITCPPDACGAQRRFRENHAPPCPYGSHGRPWPTPPPAGGETDE